MVKPLAFTARALAWVGVAAMVALAGVTLVDVVGRTFFQASLPGSAEAVAMLMGIMVFSGLGWTQLQARHVVVDVVVHALSAGVQRALKRISLLVGIAISAVLLWRMALTVAQLWQKGEITMIWKLPYAPPATLMLIGLALFLIVQLAQVADADAGRDFPQGQDDGR